MIFKKFFNNKYFPLVILLIFHFIYRLLLISKNAFPFNSDEAIVGLMAKHILGGENFLYFYGQSYMGSLDAYLVALSFLLFGEKVFAIRFVQIFLYGLSIIFLYFFIIKSFKNIRMAFFGTLFFVFPPINVVLYTTVSLGGYGEALLFGIISFYLAESILEKIESKNVTGSTVFLGIIFGLGLFVNPLSLTMIVPAIIYLFVMLTRKKKITEIRRITLVLSIFFFVGSSPFWFSLFFTNGFSTINEIAGSAVAVESTPYIDRVISHAKSFFLFAPSVIFGLRPPWGVEWIGRYALPIVIFFWILVIYLIFSRKQEKINRFRLAFLGLIVLLTVIGFIFTSFGVDPSGRYFLPLIFPLSVYFGYSVIYFRNKLVFLLSFMVLAYQIFGTYSSSLKEPFLTTQFYSPAQVNHAKIDQLINFLVEEEELYGYSNYWVSYPLAFLSDEKIIAIPKLPYHTDLRFTERDNRIDDYNENILKAERYFYISSNNPPLDILLKEKFSEKEVEYNKKTIDDYQIYFGLSKKISPEELGLMDEYK